MFFGIFCCFFFNFSLPVKSVHCLHWYYRHQKQIRNAPITPYVLDPSARNNSKRLGVAIMNSTVFRDMTPCTLADGIYRHCGEPWPYSHAFVHSCQQKSIGLKFSKSQTGSDVRYSCHRNSSRFTFPIFAHSCRFSVLHSLQSITPRIY